MRQRSLKKYPPIAPGTPDPTRLDKRAGEVIVDSRKL
jgi:hypothetical protein